MNQSCKYVYRKFGIIAMFENVEVVRLMHAVAIRDSYLPSMASSKRQRDFLQLVKNSPKPV
ncbi:hypothetical protein BDV36DRAFT_245861 [Aspergillus pseudocaelatus]|uniref:Uncharacterized protein n=1 Tax=Aspergillus pseudocaelatus TaxID=1825620 RepID=A0ABQ6X0H3_9EURO|nr:hypothetical protein BDV36DRAFT_245861 [Aspergillus pseudocaelatus]